MKFFLSSRHGPVKETREVPAHYRPYYIPAAEPLYSRGDSCNYLTQIITGRGFSIQFNIFTILAAGMLLHSRVKEALITLHFMLQGDIPCELKGFGKARLTEGLYHLFYVPGGVLHDAWFDPGTYFSFHIDLFPDSLQELAVGYPELEDTAERLLHHSGEGVQQHAARIDREVLHLIEELKHCPYRDETARNWYLENRIRELLLLYVKDKPSKSRFPSHIERRMGKAKYYMDYHLKERLTVAEVAARIKMKPTTFKKWFVQYFGKPFHQYLLEQRMEYAEKLLRETDKTLMTIADETGYSDAAAFSHAFRHYTGRAPGEHRNS